jgi:hypothetical protein
MPAATKSRNTMRVEGNKRSLPVAANVILFAGTMVVADASNFANKTSANNLRVVGVTSADVDNRGGAAGAKDVELDVGVFGPFDNSAASDLIERKDIGGNAWMVDDQTVARTSGSNTRAQAGLIHHVDARGVWVRVL